MLTNPNLMLNAQAMDILTDWYKKSMNPSKHKLKIFKDVSRALKVRDLDFGYLKAHGCNVKKIIDSFGGKADTLDTYNNLEITNYSDMEPEYSKKKKLGKKTILAATFLILGVGFIVMQDYNPNSPSDPTNFSSVNNNTSSVDSESPIGNVLTDNPKKIDDGKPKTVDTPKTDNDIKTGDLEFQKNHQTITTSIGDFTGSVREGDPSGSYVYMTGSTGEHGIEYYRYVDLYPDNPLTDKYFKDKGLYEIYKKYNIRSISIQKINI